MMHVVETRLRGVGEWEPTDFGRLREKDAQKDAKLWEKRHPRMETRVTPYLRGSGR